LIACLQQVHVVCAAWLHSLHPQIDVSVKLFFVLSDRRKRRCLDSFRYRSHAYLVRLDTLPLGVVGWAKIPTLVHFICLRKKCWVVFLAPIGVCLSTLLVIVELTRKVDSAAPHVVVIDTCLIKHHRGIVLHIVRIVSRLTHLSVVASNYLLFLNTKSSC